MKEKPWIKTKQIAPIRVSESLYNTIQQKAEAAGLSVSEFLHRAASIVDPNQCKY